MTLSSMTGFARVDGALGEARWSWEIKSVNGRSLETRFRLPPGFDFLEPDLRRALSGLFSRGSFNVQLNLRGGTGEGDFLVNRAALDQALALVEEIRDRLDCDKSRPEGILALRGVIEQGAPLDDGDLRTALGDAMRGSFSEAALDLAGARTDEGRTLGGVLAAQLGEVARLARLAREAAASAPDLLRDRLKVQLADLLAGALPDDRIAQEAAILALKADVREELDRLDAHVGQGRSLLTENGAVGRRLDFLTQELNREANTLCSKAQDLVLKRIGLDLKVVIDQMREQVQNIE